MKDYLKAKKQIVKDKILNYMTKINYNINNLSRSIYFEKNILKFLLKDIEKLNSDRKVLLIFDKNVNSRFIKIF